jgi:hypothetical protein
VNRDDKYEGDILRAMVCGIAVGLAAASAITGVAPVASGAKATPSCEQTHGTTVVATTAVRVYSVGKPALNTRYACNVASGRVVALGRYDISPEGPGVTNETIAGRYVAYRLMKCPDHEEGICDVAEIRVADTRTGKVVRSREVPSVSITDLEVRSNGAAAYIVVLPDQHQEVRTVNKTGDALVDSGTAIADDSLASSGTTLYWLNAGVPHSVRF